MAVSKKKNSNSNTDHDEALARSLQEQFYNELNQQHRQDLAYSQPPWIQNEISSGGGRNGGSTQAAASAAAAAAAEIMSIDSSGAVASVTSSINDHATPKYIKAKNRLSYSSPDTAATAASNTPSPDRVPSGRLSFLGQQQQQGKHPPPMPTRSQTKESSYRSSIRTSSTRSSSTRSSPRTSPRGSPRSSPRGSPRSSPRASPKSSPRPSSSSSFSLANLLPFHNNDTTNDTTNDEALARRLEQELGDAELAASLAHAEQQHQQQFASAADVDVDRQIPMGNSVPANNHPRFQRSASEHVPANNHPRFQRSVSDNVPANNHPRYSHGSRLQRSASEHVPASSDPVLARALQRSASTQARNNPPSNNNSKECRRKTVYYTARIGLSVVIAGIAFVLYITMFGSRTTDALDPSSWLPGYPEMDPSLGSVGEHNMWKPTNDNNNDGLTLTVLDNLQYGSDWDEHLQSSIAEWDNGTPDAVTLNIRTMTHDPDCRAVRSAMKVCNANYGPTDWRGVNQILLQDEYIITSLAKMNDYYLEGTNKAQKQYTMCHELGHGLGLGHSDENFHNKDLGNCMDYTERPQNNMHPDKSNFETLEKLYGNINGNGNGNNNNLRVERSAVMDGDGGDRRRMSSKEEEEEFEKYSAYLLEDPTVETVFSSSKSPDDLKGEAGGWRLLRKTNSAELHERRLGNGYSILTSVLLA